MTTLSTRLRYIEALYRMPEDGGKQFIVDFYAVARQFYKLPQ
jgi:hypothetical protein